MWKPAVAMAMAFGAIACRYQPTPVALQGAPADIAALQGEWSGEYSSPDSRRSGSITLTIRAGTDTAFGDVVMVTSGGQAVHAADDPHAHKLHSPSTDVLRIAFVRIFGGMVAGELEPYIAPDCGCRVNTVFQGTVHRNRVSGEYFTTGPGGLRQQGTWSASRKLVASR
jgi:hypothetical protein